MSGALARLPDLLAAHVLLSAAALLLGLLISLPLAVAASRRPALARAALGLASLVQTIPALALLALFYPVLIALSGLVGGGIPALGFLPALLALTLYAVLPILRNAVTGLIGLDPALTEAADGVGMTAGQKLRLVQAPLAAPVAMAGIRTAAVWTIGAATLATTVGQPCLGDLIFAGLQTQDWTLVLTGCIASALLALITDALLGLVETGIRRRRALLAWIGVALIALGIGAATLPALTAAPVTQKTVVIGAKNFSEQFILARLIGLRLERAGYTVRYREGLGSAVIFRALAAGDIGIYVDYSGTLWTNEMKRRDVPPRAVMLAQLTGWAERQGIGMPGALGFENAYAIAVRGADARRLKLETLDDLVRVAPNMVLGGDLEFLERPEWAALKRAYPLRFRATRAFSPTFMYRALESGQADAISAFSSDGRIASMQLKILADPRGAVPGYDAVMLVSPQKAKDPALMAALAPLAAKIPVDLMREANYRVDRDADKQSPQDVARWLDGRIGR